MEKRAKRNTEKNEEEKSMAMKTLLLKQEIDKKRASLAGVLNKVKPLEERSAELLKRADTVENEEEKEAFEKDLSLFKDEYEKLEALQKEQEALENKIKELEEQLKKEEEVQKKKQEQEATPQTTERKEIYTMGNRSNFGGLTRELIQNTEVQELLSNVRRMGKRDAGVQNAQLTIPEVMIEVLRTKIDSYSKMLKHTNLQKIKGNERQRITGEPSEAVWTEQCASTNLLSIPFHQVEVEGYMVSGAFIVCNAVLEDNDLNLTSILIDSLSKSIGYAIDRAFFYGTGIKMPLGIATRLAQTSQPDNYSNIERPWKDLHTSNIKTLSATDSKGIKLFENIVSASGAMDNSYDNGSLFWAMNRSTYTKLLVAAMSINAAGAIVSGQNNTMPIIGGNIEILPKSIIPDDNIHGGYDHLYLMAERSGTKISQSEHARFLENETVYKGVARYDGRPSIPEGFILLGIDGTAPTTTSEFAPDKANVETPADTDTGAGE